MIRLLALSALAIVPTQAAAFNAGFVRFPDWMDPYALTLFISSAVLFVLTLAFKPRGVAWNDMYNNTDKFSPAGRIVYFLLGMSFLALMVLVFVGMGLQRYAEAG